MREKNLSLKIEFSSFTNEREKRNKTQRKKKPNWRWYISNGSKLSQFGVHFDHFNYFAFVSLEIVNICCCCCVRSITWFSLKSHFIQSIDRRTFSISFLFCRLRLLLLLLLLCTRKRFQPSSILQHKWFNCSQFVFVSTQWKCLLLLFCSPKIRTIPSQIFYCRFLENGIQDCLTILLPDFCHFKKKKRKKNWTSESNVVSGVMLYLRHIISVCTITLRLIVMMMADGGALSQQTHNSRAPSISREKNLKSFHLLR